MESEKSYSFGLISDVHIDLEGGGERVYFCMAEQNFADALRFFRERGAAFLLSAGDQITAADAVQPEWEAYRRIIHASGYDKPIFAAFGNHEARQALYGATMEEMFAAFLSATRDHRGMGAEGRLYYRFTEPMFGDLYIVMADEGGMQVPLTDAFSAAQLDWLESLLTEAARQDRRVFLIQHAAVYGSGVGDDPDRPAFNGALRTDGRFRMNTRFVRLLERFPRTIWMSGHTHVDLRDGANYRRSPGSCHMIHIPALCGTTRLVRASDGSPAIDRTFRPNTAQAYLVRVYADRTEFIGVNCNTNEEYPQARYTIARENEMQ